MADFVSAAKRSKIMRGVRSKNTRPEIRVRKVLHRLGYRFRLHRKDLPGKPDIVLPRLKVVIQVNGCFWHQHSCKDGRLPGSNKEFWREKLERNKARDERTSGELAALGWTVFVIWECEARNDPQIEERLRQFLERER